jgi:hypothetical protein
VLDDGFQAHVDLPSFSRDYGSPGPNAQTVHGPWTLGILFAKHDAKGVEGTVPAATPAFCYSEDADLGETLASQLELAVAELLPGDVFLVESVGAGGLPAEEADDVKLVFRLAEAKGIHVVEPAGNVEENLDSQEYEGRYKEGPDDSGAILVTGAVERCHDIGCYGARVDCFAWSSDVATTSTGNGYKLNHGGTSSASAMTAGAIAFASAYAKQKHGRTILPRTLRKMVNQHGTAKKAGQPKIGRQPDVAKLLKKIDPLGNADFFPQP